MKRIALRVIGVCFGSLAIVLFAAACAGGIGAPTESGITTTVESQNLTGPALASPQLYISNLHGSVLVYSIGSDPTLVQTITNGVAQPGGIWVDKRGTLYAG